MDLERRHLEHLAAVAEHRNVTRAAEALGMTQPALSRSIQEIERLLGLRLFDRLPQGAVPTSACLGLLGRARALIDGFEDLAREAQRLGEHYAGALAIGLGPAAAAGSAPVEIGRFLALHRRLRCRVAIAAPHELAQRLRSLELDFVVADQTSIEEGAASLVLEPLEYEAVLLCRPGHPVLRAACPEAEVSRYPFAVMGPAAAGLDALRAFLRRHSPALPADWMPALALDQASALGRLLAAGDFVGASGAHAHAPELRAGALRVIPVRESIYRGRVGPIRVRDRALSPAAEALWKVLLDALREDLLAGSDLERELR